MHHDLAIELLRALRTLQKRYAQIGVAHTTVKAPVEITEASLRGLISHHEKALEAHDAAAARVEAAAKREAVPMEAADLSALDAPMALEEEDDALIARLCE